LFVASKTVPERRSAFPIDWSVNQPEEYRMRLLREQESLKGSASMAG
jgi:hypothetical protein